MLLAFRRNAAVRRPALRPRLHRNPLPVQFWLWGLDARAGLLTQQGFAKTPAPIGSSFYQRGAFKLHSSGLWLALPQGELYYWRSQESFYLDGRSLRRLEGLALLRPWVVSHEREYAVACKLTADLPSRQQQLAGRLPPRIRRLKPTWEAWVAAPEPSLALAAD